MCLRLLLTSRCQPEGRYVWMFPDRAGITFHAPSIFAPMYTERVVPQRTQGNVPTCSISMEKTSKPNFWCCVHLQNIEAKFIYQGHRVKVKVTGAKNGIYDRNEIHTFTCVQPSIEIREILLGLSVGYGWLGCVALLIWVHVVGYYCF